MSTCPSIHFSLDEDTLKITVGCLVCGVVCVWCVVVVCCGGVCLLLCMLLCCGGACVWCVVKLGTLSLSLVLSPSSSLSLSFTLLSFFFSLLFLFPFLLLLLLLLLLFFLFLLSSFPSTHSSLLFPSRQQSLYKALINKHGVQL